MSAWKLRTGARRGEHRGDQAGRGRPHAAPVPQLSPGRDLPARRLQRGDRGRPPRRRRDREAPGRGDRLAHGRGWTGKLIAQNAADTLKRVHLELGGKAPVVVFDDADLAAAAEWIKIAGYFNSGQDCTAPPRDRGTQGVRRPGLGVVSKVSEMKVGDVFDDEAEMGSVVSDVQLDRVTGFVDRAREGGAAITRWRGDRPAGLLVCANGGDRRRPGLRDRAERGLRPGGDVPAVLRRGAPPSSGRTVSTTVSRPRCGPGTSAGRSGCRAAPVRHVCGSTRTSR